MNAKLYVRAAAAVTTLTTLATLTGATRKWVNPSGLTAREPSTADTGGARLFCVTPKEVRMRRISSLGFYVATASPSSVEL